MFKKFVTDVCVAVSLGVAAMAASSPALANDPPFKVTLLGTGSPIPNPDRFSQSILVEAGKQKLLIDLGRGVTVRLGQLGIPLRDINASFITHMHSDHLTGLPDFWLTGWLPTSFGSRETPMKLYGPKGTKELAEYLPKAFAEDIRIRTVDEELRAPGIAIEAHEFKAPGVVYEQDGVKVTAFETDHGPQIKPSFGYTISFNGRKVVIPSDSRYDERIVAEARNADLLIHEVAMIDADLMKTNPRLHNVLNHHTSPEDAGRIFSQAKPRLAAYSHFVIFHRGKGVTASADREIDRLTRTTYEGPLVLGHDLMSFDIGDSVTVTGADGKKIMTVSSKP